MADDQLDDEHPLWLVNEQIKGLLEGEGASEDHENVVNFLLRTGLPRGTVDRMHRALVGADRRLRNPPPPTLPKDTRGCPECAHSDSYGLPDRAFCNHCVVLGYAGHRGTHFKPLNGG